MTDKDDFNTFTKNSKVCVVDFGASWCGPCKKLSETLAKTIKKDNLFTPDMSKNNIEMSIKNKITVLKIDTDEFNEYSTAHSVSGIPHVVFYKNGVLQSEKFVGYNSDTVKNILKTIDKLSNE
jgi:thioredoxin 1